MANSSVFALPRKTAPSSRSLATTVASKGERNPSRMREPAVVGASTVREPDGLALSSRNRYLSAEERREALALSAALGAAKDAAVRGVTAALEAARGELASRPLVELDYFTVVDPGTFLESWSVRPQGS